MSKIGLDKLYYAKIADNDGDEDYDEPIVFAKGIKADLSVELSEGILYADDTIAEIVKEFKSGKLALSVDDIGAAVASDLTGELVDERGVLISTGEDKSNYVAIGFRALQGDGKYRYFWFYRVKFGIPATNLETKADSIKFSTPTIEGVVMRRNKTDGYGTHPWKAEVVEGGAGVSAGTITNWFDDVYEPAAVSGTKQIETATVVGTIGAAGVGVASVIITSALFGVAPLAVLVAVANNDTASQVAGKIRIALNNISLITTYYTVTGSNAAIILTAVYAAANDITLNIAIDNSTCSGLTPALTSADTLAGVAAS